MLGLFDYLLIGVTSLFVALLLLVAYSQGIAVARKMLPLPIGVVGTLAASLIIFVVYSFAVSFFGIIFIDCCYEGTTLPTATEMYFIDNILAPALIPHSIVFMSLTALLGLAVFSLAKFNPGWFVAVSLFLIAAPFVGRLYWVNISAGTFTYAVPEAQDLPVFPGARDLLIDRDSFSWFNWHDISFNTDKPFADVLAFYKEEMPKRGWAYQSSSSGDSTAVFLRNDTGVAAPWKYEFTVNVTLLTKVLMWARRYPDLDRTPIYPGATQINQGSKAIVGDTREHTLTFIAQDSPDNIRAWYRDRMNEYRWWKEGIIEDAPPESVQFVYEVVESPSGHKAADMYVLATAQPDGKTKVDVRAVGYGIP